MDCSSLFEWDSSHDAVFGNAKVHTLGRYLCLGKLLILVGVQIAGWAYHQFSPQAAYYTVLITILLKAFSVYVGSMKKKRDSREKEKHPVSIRLFFNGPYLFFIVLIGLASGVEDGHTYS